MGFFPFQLSKHLCQEHNWFDFSMGSERFHSALFQLGLGERLQRHWHRLVLQRPQLRRDAGSGRWKNNVVTVGSTFNKGLTIINIFTRETGEDLFCIFGIYRIYYTCTADLDRWPSPFWYKYLGPQFHKRRDEESKLPGIFGAISYPWRLWQLWGSLLVGWSDGTTLDFR